MAHELLDRGHEVRVLAAHPHYPEPQWGTSRRPYRETRDGVPVLRLPLWVGRASAAERYRQELTYMAAQTAALPWSGKADIAVVVSPSFPALLPAVLNGRLRRLPWILWLHDILPDGAAATGIVESGAVLGAARALERLAYREADRIVVLSRPFVENLRAKGVPDDRLELIYDPATREPSGPPAAPDDGPLTLLCMGNIGFSQGLAPLVAAFDAPGALPDDCDTRLVITGVGVAADDARAEIRTGRVQMPGLVDSERLERELLGAHVGVITQQYEGSEFNIPSKLMNYMAYGLPVLAAVNPGGEVARIVREAGAGWIVDSSTPEALPQQVAALAADRSQLAAKSAAARAYADEHFTREAFGRRFSATIEDVAAAAPRPRSRARRIG